MIVRIKKTRTIIIPTKHFIKYGYSSSIISLMIGLRISVLNTFIFSSFFISVDNSRSIFLIISDSLIYLDNNKLIIL